MAQKYEESEVFVIRTLECDLCQRFDSIMITKREMFERISRNKLQIGSYYLNHNDHVRVVYFDLDGKYLGDTISLNLRDDITTHINGSIPIFPKVKKGVAYTFIRKMMSQFLSTSQTISIIGPSLVGKTSLTYYLETGIPERHSQRIDHSATMGKSVKRMKIGNINLKILDMGGQKDFWGGWEESIRESDKIIFIFDGTAFNYEEIADSLSLAIDYRSERLVPFLILVNKMDLFIDGYTNKFSSVDEINNSLEITNPRDIWTLETSIYNGLCYNYGAEQSETPLSKVISDFLILN
ncbi:MAG: hypothetical protein HeimC2_01660 [Candidatus Heimdallarchaeota archaeon LC_2]|nr:MAG: hypothetical protein HeimC2_01660 [Candidatus Heimdallarchaeota archaeon LC_2]